MAVLSVYLNDQEYGTIKQGVRKYAQAHKWTLSRAIVELLKEAIHKMSSPQTSSGVDTFCGSWKTTWSAEKIIGEIHKTRKNRGT